MSTIGRPIVYFYRQYLLVFAVSQQSLNFFDDLLADGVGAAGSKGSHNDGFLETGPAYGAAIKNFLAGLPKEAR